MFPWRNDVPDDESNCRSGLERSHGTISVTCTVSPTHRHVAGRNHGVLRPAIRRLDLAPSIPRCLPAHSIHRIGPHSRGHCRSHVVRCLHWGTQESHLGARWPVLIGASPPVCIFDDWSCGHRRIMGKFCRLVRVGGGDGDNPAGRHPAARRVPGCKIRSRVRRLCRACRTLHAPSLRLAKRLHWEDQSGCRCENLYSVMFLFDGRPCGGSFAEWGQLSGVLPILVNLP